MASPDTGGGRPTHVLVESDDPYRTMADAVAFADAGFDVVICGGPANGETCTALDGMPCPLVTDADVVLNDISDSETRTAIADAVRATTPDVPVVVRLPAGGDDDVTPGCLRLSANASVSAQVAALRDAASGRRAVATDAQ
jgi:hypothetical protein